MYLVQDSTHLDYDSYVIEYTIRESEQDSGPGQGYQRVGQMLIVGRQDFGSGTGDVCLPGQWFRNG